MPLLYRALIAFNSLLVTFQKKTKPAARPEQLLGIVVHLGEIIKMSILIFTTPAYAISADPIDAPLAA